MKTALTLCKLKCDARPFKVPCEQSENLKRSRVNKASDKMFQPVGKFDRFCVNVG